ncbi:hypothetical protein [Rubritalea tangerina]|uniref:Uncharacterized protein n=1 Tax=Rubritalea tangerina TaxID=430798 RepID=A0ABW4Z830_9BACT
MAHSRKHRRDSYLDPRLAEFLSDEDRYRQQFLAVSGIILLGIVVLFGSLFLLWSYLSS